MKMNIILLPGLMSLFLLNIQAQTVPDITGSEVTKEEAQLSLDFHNKVRADVGIFALNWSAKLAKFAQQWADHLASEGCILQHRPNSGVWATIYGENIFWGSGSDYTVMDATESWYSEIKKYTHGVQTNDNWYKTGHYTQMVWRNTTHVGIGVARCKNGGMIIVANYDPPGNYMGETAY